MAPDHVQTFMYSGTAAKLSKVLRILGFTALADTWLASAEAAYDWAEEIYTNAVSRNAYYLTTKTNAGWDDTTYNARMATMQKTWVPHGRHFAAASLLSAVTGNRPRSPSTRTHLKPLRQVASIPAVTLVGHSGNTSITRTLTRSSGRRCEILFSAMRRIFRGVARSCG